MSSIDHVISECGRLRAAWTWLTETRIPGRARRNQRALTESAKQKRDRRAREDRNDRPHLFNAGKIVGGGQPPANLNAIEAQRQIADNIQDIAHEISLRVATTGPTGTSYRPDPTNTNTRFTGALNWISLNIIRLSPDDRPILNTAYRTLTASANLAEYIAGCGPDLRPLAAECPACGYRTLCWDCTSPEPAEWSVRCTNPNCRCRGRNCPCQHPDRQPRTPHVWLESSWDLLAARLNGKTPA